MIIIILTEKDMDRVRIDFWIQNSRLFPKQQFFFFFQTQGYQMSDQLRHLKKHGNKALFNDILQTHRQD